MSTSNELSNMTQSELHAYLSLGCHAATPLMETSYGYVPSLAAGVIFSILFGIPMIYHTYQFCRVRRATSILLALGALTELIGWASRAYSSTCPYSDAFLSQIVTLIIAPVFFSAALYVLLGILIMDLGRASSVLSAKWYAIIFCTSDVVSLIVQSAGGAMAATGDTEDAEKLGTNVMVGGIALQLATMTVFGLMLGDFARRIGSRRLGMRQSITPGLKMILGAVLVSFVMIYIRSIYRTVELVQGWNGYLLSHEGYFIGLDAAIMVVAVAVFIPVDPAVIMRGPKYLRAKQAGADASDGETAIPMESHNGAYGSH